MADSSTQSAADEGFNLDIRELLLKLWRRKGLILGTMVVLTMIPLLVILQLTPRYEAETHVMIDARKSRMLNLESVVSGLPADVESIESEVQVITSRDLVNKVVAELQLDTLPEFNAALRPPGVFGQLKESLLGADWIRALTGNYEEALQDPEEAAAKTRNRSINAFLEKLQVGPMGRSRVIRIAFESESPKLAATIANTLADFYIVAQLEAKFDTTRRANAWLTEHLEELRNNVNLAEAAVERYRSEAGLIGGGSGSTLVGQEISGLNEQLVLEKTKRAEAEARLSQIQRLLAQPNGTESATEVLQSNTISNLREQEAQVIRKVAELGDEYGEKHPRMVGARSELADLQSKIQSEVARIAEALRNEVQVARARESTLQNNLNRLRSEVTDLNQSEVRLRALQREAEANRNLLETFLARAKETGAQEGFEQPDATIVSHAAIPQVPSYPRKGMLLGIAFLISAAVGVGFAFLVEQLDHGFRSGEQIERMTGLSSLALLPRIGGLPGMRKSPLREVVDNPFSGFSEAVRSLYLAVLLSDSEKAPRRLLVTSAHPGEGKTTTASCIAVTVARVQKKPIVIDCDLRRPTLHDQFGISEKPGLIDLLTDDNVQLRDVIVLHEDSGVSVLPAGGKRGDLGILGSDRFASLLDELSKTYDLIVLDSAPLLAVSDAQLLSRLVDKTIFVVRWAHTKREFAMAALKQLRHARANIAGVALTLVDPKEHSLYGYGDSGYYHRSVRKYYKT